MQSTIHKGFLAFCLYLLLSGSAYASSGVYPIRIAIGKAMKPYVLNQRHGIVIDLIRQAFSFNNQTVEFVFLSNEKALRAFQNKSVDAIAIVKPTMVNTWLSDNFISYQNQAVTLESTQTSINKLSDLANYRVTGFSHAHVYLGNEFNQAVSNNPQYREVVDQFEQVKALFDGKTEVIILDQTIFKFHLKQLRNKYPTNTIYRQPIKMLPLFTPSDYRVAFNSEILQKSFNSGFSKLKEAGQVQKIYQKYTRLLGSY